MALESIDRVVLMGLGVTGRAVGTALLRRDIEVIALDDKPGEAIVEWAQSKNIEVRSSGDVDLAVTLASADALIPAPGLPDHHPIFVAASQSGTPVLSEFDLAAAWDDRPCIAITGTDGKTTVVTLVQRMLEASGIAAVAVGNTDTPYVQAIDDSNIEVFVVEASSFRLGHSQHFAPRVATWLNFGPDHLDAHTDLASYEAAKASIWKHLGADACAIGNRDDTTIARHLGDVAQRGGVSIESFGASAPAHHSEHGLCDDMLIVAGEPLIRIDEMARALPHDVQNALAAAASALRVGADRSAIATVLREFDGLEHRVELIGEIDGVRYVNDSKATTPHASAAALSGFDRIVLLAGGKNKGLSFDDMLDYVDHLTHVVAIGDAAADIEALFRDRVPTTVATSMEDAIDQAAAHAQRGDVVLLSPACASFDWYSSYVERGRDFTRLVQARMARAATTATMSPAPIAGDR